MVLDELRIGDQLGFQVQKFDPKTESWMAYSKIHPDLMLVKHLIKNFRIALPGEYRIIKIRINVSVMREL